MQSHDFTKSSIATLLLVVVFLCFWEYYWRSKGNMIAFNEDKAMWGTTRKKIYAPPGEATVFIGDSRVKFDIDIPTWKALTGEDVIQLALVGTSPRPVLQDLANDEKFKGKVVMGASEPALFSLDNPQREISARDGIEYYKNETPAQKVNESLNLMLESNFVFLEEGKFGLNAILNWLPLSNRAGVFIRTGPPRDFSSANIERQSSMTSIFFKDSSVQQAVINYWALSASRNRANPIKGDTLKIFIKQYKTFIDKIRARGGKVVIIRPPSTGAVLAREKNRYPREQYWDRFTEYTGLSGFYYLDNPETAVLDCPEESHLSPAGARIFTRALVNFLREKEGWSFPVKPDSTSNHIKQ